VPSSFHKNWKQFLDPALLTEARVKDVKAKYPDLELAGFITYARKSLHDDFGPKGVSKYLMWFARELYQNFKDDIEGDNHWHANAPHDTDVFEIANALLGIIGQFQQHHQRLKEKDIYKYEPEQLRAELESLGLSQSQKRKKEKEGAMEGSELIYDENDIFAIRPLTKEASCFYGKNTRWCISATESRNYFDQYTSDYQAFVMVRFDNIPAAHSMHKLALVYDREGELEQVFDASDDEQGESAVYDAVTMNKLGARDYELLDTDGEEKEAIDEIVADIIQNGYMNVLDNPPDPTGSWDSEITNLEAEYQEKIKHGYYSAEVEDHGDGGYVSFTGGFTVEFDEDIFEGGEYEFPDNYRDLSELSREISSKFERVQIYHEDIDISDYNDKVTFEIRISIDGYEPSPQGYDSFLYQLSEHDKEYSTMQRIIAKHLAEEGYIAKGAFDTFQATLEELQKKLKNFNITDYSEYAGEEEIIFASKENIEITDFNPKLLTHMSKALPAGKYVSDEVNQKVFEKLKALNKAIQTYLAQQLELPLSGVEPRTIRKLTLPETLRVTLYSNPTPSENSIPAKIAVRIENPEASQEEIDMVVDVVRFLDENYERVAAAAIESAQEVAAEVISAQKEFMDSLPQAAKDLLELGRKSTNHDAERRMRRVDDISIGEWKNRKEEIPTMNMFKSQVLLPLFDILRQTGEIDRGVENPFHGDEIDDLMRLTMESNKMNINIFEKLKEIYIKRSCTKKTTGEKGDCAVLSPSTKKQTACYDDCDTARAAKHMNEEAEEFFSKIKKESELDEKDNIIKSRKYEIIDIMDPDFNLWEVNDE
jgi:hypothetical protein